MCKYDLAQINRELKKELKKRGFKCKTTINRRGPTPKDKVIIFVSKNKYRSSEDIYEFCYTNAISGSRFLLEVAEFDCNEYYDKSKIINHINKKTKEEVIEMINKYLIGKKPSLYKLFDEDVQEAYLYALKIFLDICADLYFNIDIEVID